MKKNKQKSFFRSMTRDMLFIVLKPVSVLFLNISMGTHSFLIARLKIVEMAPVH